MAFRDQLDLFADYSPAPPFQAHSETSRAAARGIEPSTETLRRAVLEAIRKSGAEGMTDEELIDALAINPSTARPRRIELVQAGIVRDSGRTRPTRSGRTATVWISTEAAQ